MKSFSVCAWCGIIFSVNDATNTRYCGKCLQLPVEAPQGKAFYVYQLSTPENIPFYIGKGTVNDKIQRIFQHEYIARNSQTITPTFAKIREFLKVGKRPVYSILGFFEREQEALAFEKQQIQSLCSKHCLTNSHHVTHQHFNAEKHVLDQLSDVFQLFENNLGMFDALVLEIFRARMVVYDDELMSIEHKRLLSDKLTSLARGLSVITNDAKKNIIAPLKATRT